MGEIRAPSMTSTWGDLSGEEFMKGIDDVYTQVVHWRTSSSGASGKKFVAVLNCLFNVFALALNDSTFIDAPKTSG